MFNRLPQFKTITIRLDFLDKQVMYTFMWNSVFITRFFLKRFFKSKMRLGIIDNIFEDLFNTGTVGIYIDLITFMDIIENSFVLIVNHIDTSIIVCNSFHFHYDHL